MASGIGTAVIDFGASPVTEGSVAVAGQAAISSTSAAEAFFMARATGDNNADAHKQAAAYIRLVCSVPTAGVGFTITAYCLVGYVTGTFNIEWTWSD